MPLIYSSISNISFTDCILLSTTLIFIQFMHLSIVLQIISSLKFLLFSTGEKPGRPQYVFSVYRLLTAQFLLLRALQCYQRKYLPTLELIFTLSLSHLHSFLTLTNHCNNHLSHFTLFLFLLSVSSGLCPFLQQFSNRVFCPVFLPCQFKPLLDQLFKSIVPPSSWKKHGLCSLLFFLFQTYKKQKYHDHILLPRVLIELRRII